MTVFRGTVLDTPGDTVLGSIRLRAEADAALVVDNGRISARGPFAETVRDHPGHAVVDLRGGLILPGMVDTHVHYPQVRVIGALGMPLLQWLDECALPEEARLESIDYARQVADEFVQGLVSAGTTTALVFGSHFASAVDALFERVASAGLRSRPGWSRATARSRSNYSAPPDRFYAESMALAARWHGVDRTRYAVTPRFSYSASEDMLDACGSVLKDVEGLLVHIPRQREPRRGRGGRRALRRG